MKRLEFVMKGMEGHAYVVFEGHEANPFWRRVGDGIRFVYTNLTYRQVCAWADEPESGITHTIADTTEEEFKDYYKAACKMEGRDAEAISS